MNEIKAEAKGVITQVMVENAKPVEFGQPLVQDPSHLSIARPGPARSRWVNQNRFPLTACLKKFW